MRQSIPDVLEKAMSAHDCDAEHWLEQVKKLQELPAPLHEQALVIARAYLEELIAMRPRTAAAPLDDTKGKQL